MRSPTEVPSFVLRFPADQIASLIDKYGSGDEPMFAIGNRAQTAGYYTRPDFSAVCDWKTRGRVRRHYALNTPEDVRRQTGTALARSSDKSSIEALIALKGVGIPTASMLLHLALPKWYPVIDRRALWSLGHESPTISVPFWLDYVEFCRAQSLKYRRSLRDMDRAMFQYSRDNQPKN